MVKKDLIARLAELGVEAPKRSTIPALAALVEAAEAAAAPRSVADAVEKLLKSVELDEAGEMHAAIARALAGKLDEARGAGGGAIAMAISGIAKELRSVVDAILTNNDQDKEFVQDIFSDT